MCHLNKARTPVGIKIFATPSFYDREKSHREVAPQRFHFQSKSTSHAEVAPLCFYFRIHFPFSRYRRGQRSCHVLFSPHIRHPTRATRERNSTAPAPFSPSLLDCAHFFIKDDHLWKKDLQGHHKLVIEPNKRPAILISTHDKAGHHGDFATHTQIIDHFWWPDLAANVAWFVKTCHLCQLHQTRNILILPVVTTPAPLFVKMYMDMMHLLKSGGFKYLVQGHCSLTHYPEYCILCTETAKTISNWIFDDILCQWGALCEIVMDNGPAFIKALDYLGKCYHICHI